MLVILFGKRTVHEVGTRASCAESYCCGNRSGPGAVMAGIGPIISENQNRYKSEVKKQFFDISRKNSAPILLPSIVPSKLIQKLLHQDSNDYLLIYDTKLLCVLILVLKHMAPPD